MASSLDPATSMFGNALQSLSNYWWILIPFAAMISIGLIIFVIKKIRDKKSQWTHKLKIRRVLPGDRLSDPFYHNMRRFPLIKKAEVFELEKAVLGGYLMPELDEYSGENEFSIILDNNNRIYTNKGEFFCRDKRDRVNVSAKHSEIDIQRSNLKADFQNINKTSKRVEWATIAKYAFFVIIIIAASILAISGIQEWGEAQTAKADEAKATASAMDNLAKAMLTVQATVNTQQLLIPELKELKGTNNLQNLINNPEEDEDT